MLAAGRYRDRAAGRTLQGPHRSDLTVRHVAKDMPAALASTGEQKALLIGLVLAHAEVAAAIAGLLLACGASLAAGQVSALLPGAVRTTTSVARGPCALVAALSIASKEMLARATMRIGRRHRSAAVLANAKHHRSDALSSVVALAGVVGTRFGAFVDPAAALLVAGCVLKMGVETGQEALLELLDARDPEAEAAVHQAVAAAIPAEYAVESVAVTGRASLEVRLLVPGSTSARDVDHACRAAQRAAKRAAPEDDDEPAPKPKRGRKVPENLKTKPVDTSLICGKLDLAQNDFFHKANITNRDDLMVRIWQQKLEKNEQASRNQQSQYNQKTQAGNEAKCCITLREMTEKGEYRPMVSKACGHTCSFAGLQEQIDSMNGQLTEVRPFFICSCPFLSRAVRTRRAAVGILAPEHLGHVKKSRG